MEKYINIKLTNDDVYLIHQMPLKKIYDGYGTDKKNLAQNLYEYIFILIKESSDRGQFGFSLDIDMDSASDMISIITDVKKLVDKLGYNITTKKTSDDRYTISVHWLNAKIDTNEDRIALQFTNTDHPYANITLTNTISILTEQINMINAEMHDEMKYFLYNQLLLPESKRSNKYVVDFTKPITLRGMQYPISCIAASRFIKVMMDAEKLGCCKVIMSNAQRNFFEGGFMKTYSLEERFKIKVPDSYNKVTIEFTKDYVYVPTKKNTTSNK